MVASSASQLGWCSAIADRCDSAPQQASGRPRALSRPVLPVPRYRGGYARSHTGVAPTITTTTHLPPLVPIPPVLAARLLTCPPPSCPLRVPRLLRRQRHRHPQRIRQLALCQLPSRHRSVSKAPPAPPVPHRATPSATPSAMPSTTPTNQSPAQCVPARPAPRACPWRAPGAGQLTRSRRPDATPPPPPAEVAPLDCLQLALDAPGCASCASQSGLPCQAQGTAVFGVCSSSLISDPAAAICAAGEALACRRVL